MNEHMTPSVESAHEPMPALEDMLKGVLATSEHLVRESRQRFNEIFPRLALRLMGTEARADAALKSGGFLIDESTVVIRYDETRVEIQFFCDIGLPETYEETVIYRSALEYNLCRTYPGITLGVHPDSGRLVATTALSFLLVADDEVCFNTVEILVHCAKQVRQALRIGKA